MRPFRPCPTHASFVFKLRGKGQVTCQLSSARLSRCFLSPSPFPEPRRPFVSPDSCSFSPCSRSGTLKQAPHLPPPSLSFVPRWNFILNLVSPPLWVSTTLDERPQFRLPAHLSGVCPSPRSTVRPRIAFMLTIHAHPLCRTLGISHIPPSRHPTPTTQSLTLPSHLSQLFFPEKTGRCRCFNERRTITSDPLPPIPPPSINKISPVACRRRR